MIDELTESVPNVLISEKVSLRATITIDYRVNLCFYETNNIPEIIRLETKDLVEGKSTLDELVALGKLVDVQICQQKPA